MALSQPIFLTNTLGRELQEFHPVDPPRVLFYSCGPTVYNYAHLGNFRAYIVADTLRRMLDYNGYQVVHVRNITDVGHLTDDTLNTGLDKIEAAARRHNATPWDIARHYTEVFWRDADLLNLKPPHHEPRATEYIEEMIRLTQQLIERGYAYPSDGNVYFEVSQFPRYGQFSGNSVEDLVAGARVEVGEGKRAPADFALWKVAGPDKIMRWGSPWGEGVPGWHIECSAMAMTLLGEEIDVHSGGVDHIFPHHEDEIAQSEGATGRRFARYWLHNEFLQTPADEKMSKSLGNIITLSELMEQGIHPLAYRYFTFQAHYRRPLHFSVAAVEAAQTALFRIWEAVAELTQAAAVAEALDPDAEQYQERFHAAINRDLDLPVAIAVLQEVLGSRLAPGQKLALVQDFDSILALDMVEMGRRLSELSGDEKSLLERRVEARSRKDWQASDQLRDELSRHGLAVKDTVQGQRWVRTDLLPSRDGSSDDATQQ